MTIFYFAQFEHELFGVILSVFMLFLLNMVIMWVNEKFSDVGVNNKTRALSECWDFLDKSVDEA